jgi:S-adenosylmethionine decarboxylase
MDTRGELVICDVLFKEEVPTDILITIENSLCANNIKVVNKCKHEFEPQGLTKIWILSASHFGLHTYPEANYISMDCYTCSGEGSATKTMDYIIKYYKEYIKSYTFKTIERGNI